MKNVLGLFQEEAVCLLEKENKKVVVVIYENRREMPDYKNRVIRQRRKADDSIELVVSSFKIDSF
ncbi:MAG: hypothetical protein R2876_00085 [Eubacteriales bacterium]